VAEDDPHAILGVAKGATLEEIRAAFRAKARAYHPDARPDDPDAAAKFRQIREAYQILRGAQAPKRKKGDSERPRERERAREPKEHDVFERIFKKKREQARYGSSPFGGDPARAGRMRVPFAAAIRGGDHLLEVEFDQPGGRRRLRVTLPPGVENGQTFRLEGKLVRAVVEPHPHLVREGSDLCVDVPVTLAELSLGARIRVPTIDGMVEVQVPPRSRPGHRLRLKGKGVGGEGDQLCALVLALPAPSPEVQAILRALDRADSRSPRPWDPPGEKTGLDDD
jgi:curved DNA-binding protein